MSSNCFKTVCCLIVVWNAAILIFSNPVEATSTDHGVGKPCQPNFFYSEFAHGCSPCLQLSNCKREQSGDMERCQKACAHARPAATPVSNGNATRKTEKLSTVNHSTSAKPSSTKAEGSNSFTDGPWFAVVLGVLAVLSLIGLTGLAVFLLRSKCRRVKTGETNEGEMDLEPNEKEMARLASSSNCIVVAIPERNSNEGVESLPEAQTAKSSVISIPSTVQHTSDMNLSETSF